MTRALVLGGRGPVALAWESGLIAGFAQGGVDLAAADFILGTSAGAVVGARLASGAEGARLAETMLDRAATPVHPPPRAAPDDQILALLEEAQSGARNPAEVRRELGALAQRAVTGSEAEFLELVRRELGDIPLAGWPSASFACTAVDVEDGGFQLWLAQSGVDLLPAVGASACVPGTAPPVSLNGRRYMDGGARSPTNADLAAGHELVVVIAAVPPGADRAGGLLAEEIDSLQSVDATVVAVTLDDGSAAACGPDAMDARRQPDAARAGLAQGLSQAEILKPLWAGAR